MRKANREMPTEVEAQSLGRSTGRSGGPGSLSPLSLSFVPELTATGADYVSVGADAFSAFRNIS
jgi:hypothetical protein